MPRYTVGVKILTTYFVTVDADSAIDAEEMVSDMDFYRIREAGTLQKAETWEIAWQRKEKDATRD